MASPQSGGITLSRVWLIEHMADWHENTTNAHGYNASRESVMPSGGNWTHDNKEEMGGTSTRIR